MFALIKRVLDLAGSFSPAARRRVPSRILRTFPTAS